MINIIKSKYIVNPRTHDTHHYHIKWYEHYYNKYKYYELKQCTLEKGKKKRKVTIKNVRMPMNGQFGNSDM